MESSQKRVNWILKNGRLRLLIIIVIANFYGPSFSVAKSLDLVQSTTETGQTEPSFVGTTEFSMDLFNPKSNSEPTAVISSTKCSLPSQYTEYVPEGFFPSQYNSLECPPKITTLNESDFIPQTNRTATVVLMAISKIRGLDEKEEELTVEVDFELMWRDGRLNPWIISNATVPTLYPINPKLLDKMWHPHIYIEQLVSNARPSLITAPTKLNIYAVPDPYVHYGLRSDVVTACEMDYHFYPVDVTKCRIDIKSCEHFELNPSFLVSNQYEIETLFLTWPKGREGVLIPADIDLPGFDIHIVGKSNSTLGDIQGSQYSTLGFTIALKRHMSYHMIQTYLPSLIFIIISWGSFLIPDESATERIGCALVSLLSLMVMLDSIGQTIPQVTYLTALHVWMIGCILFVFIPLLEVLVVFKLWSMEKSAKKQEAMARRKKSRKTKTLSLTSSLSSDEFKMALPSSTNSSQVNILIDKEGNLDLESVETRLKSQTLRMIADTTEEKMVLVIPALFLLFNAIYWPWLLTGDPIEDENVSSFVKQ